MTAAITHIAETSLYVDDLPRALDFYVRLFGLPIVRHDERFSVLRINEFAVLILFRRGASLQPIPLPGGEVPAHDGHGPSHICFGIAKESVETWTKELEDLGIPLESRVNWPSGAVSLYFRDPDQHAVELATPGIWDETQGEPEPTDPSDRLSSTATTRRSTSLPIRV